MEKWNAPLSTLFFGERIKIFDVGVYLGLAALALWLASREAKR
jgi:hypothetical protein